MPSMLISLAVTRLVTRRRVNGYLTNTQVTDAGLGHLKGLAKLQELNLMLTQVTDAGVDDLQKALPKCRIHHFKIQR